MPRACRFAELLVGPAIERGLLGPREASVIWSRHILNCAALLPLLDGGPIGGVAGGVAGGTGEVLDLGSGAGLPGLVLALARPQLPITLAEPMARRCAFLIEAVTELGLAAVQVRRARAEDLASEVSAAAVVARAVAPLARLVTLAAPLVAPGGELLALKGRTASRELAAAAASLHRHNATADIHRIAIAGAAEAATVVRVRFPLRVR